MNRDIIGFFTYKQSDIPRQALFSEKHITGPVHGVFPQVNKISYVSFLHLEILTSTTML